MSFLNSKIFTVPLLALTVWILFSVMSAEVEKNEIKKEETVVENKITDVKLDNELLGRYIKSFKNPDFLEKEARIRLNYKAFGEEVVFVHRNLNLQKSSSAEELSPEDLPNYKKWWHYLLSY